MGPVTVLQMTQLAAMIAEASRIVAACWRMMPVAPGVTLAHRIAAFTAPMAAELRRSLPALAAVAEEHVEALVVEAVAASEAASGIVAR